MAPEQDAKERVLPRAGVAERVETFHEDEPKAAMVRGHQIERPGGQAALATALVSVIDEIPQILTVVSAWMKQASRRASSFIEKAQGPAGESHDGPEPGAVAQVPDAIVGELPGNAASIVKMVIACRADGRTAGETGKRLAWCAKVHDVISARVERFRPQGLSLAQSGTPE